MSKHAAPESVTAILALFLAAFPAAAAAADDNGRRFPQVANPRFWKGRVEEIEAAVAAVKAGKVQVIARSPGGRPVHLIEYGPRIGPKRQANYGSAAGAGDPRHYASREEGSPPVVFLVGPPHGHEVEGMVGLVNLMHVAETGADLRGKEWPRLTESLRRSRLLIVPISNPDGRARCVYDNFSGIPVDEMTRIGQGTRKDGTLYGWPGVKQRHPMKGDVGLLGAYFNDDGINLMHDEFFAPMAEETKALLRVAREEAPEFLMILHSHGAAPEVLPTAYVPRFQKEAAARFGARLVARYRSAGLPAGRVPEPTEDGAKYPPPSFNLTSALHHVCGGLSMLFECPHGLKETQYPQVTFDQILDLELILFEELLAFALEEPRPVAGKKTAAAGGSAQSPRAPYGTWKNGPPSGADYFPIAVWLQDPRNAVKYKEAGINLYVGLWKGPTEAQLDALRGAGMSVICSQNQVGLARRSDPTIIGWMHGDEPDNAQPIRDPATGKESYGPPVPPRKIVEDGFGPYEVRLYRIR